MMVPYTGEFFIGPTITVVNAVETSIKHKITVFNAVETSIRPRMTVPNT